MTPGDVYITSRGMLWRYMGDDEWGCLMFRLGYHGQGKMEKHAIFPKKWKLYESAKPKAKTQRIGNHKSPFGIGA